MRGGKGNYFLGCYPRLCTTSFDSVKWPTINYQHSQMEKGLPSQRLQKCGISYIVVRSCTRSFIISKIQSSGYWNYKHNPRFVFFQYFQNLIVPGNVSLWFILVIHLLCLIGTYWAILASSRLARPLVLDMLLFGEPSTLHLGPWHFTSLFLTFSKKALMPVLDLSPGVT